MNQTRSRARSGRSRDTDSTGAPAVIPLLTVNSTPQHVSDNDLLSSADRPLARPGGSDPDRLHDIHFINSRARQNTTGSDQSNIGAPYHRPQSSAASLQHPTQTGNEANSSALGPIPRVAVAAVAGQQNDMRRVRETEQATVDRKDLGTWDVASLIINKQIGTGIFTAPGIVLSLTGSKTIALTLWVVGGIWALLSVVIYVEFGVAFPFNGGELIYLDEVFKTPELLATLLFSGFFIFCPNSDGNAIQFAKHVLLRYTPEAKTTEELNESMITLLAILVLTFVCLIHYFSRNSGLFLNKIFAIYKICLVSSFIIAGFHMASTNPGPALKDWNESRASPSGALTALIYVLYSYQGWENANYVGGELKIDRTTLRNGAYLAVAITTLLYTLATSAYSAACTFDELAGQDLGVISHFAPLVFSNVDAVKVSIALSAFGNLLAVVYTSVRVKQQIARQCLLPFFRFFSSTDSQFGTPVGALVLHWLFASVWIIITPNTSDGYAFIIGMFIYGQLLVGVAMGFAFIFLRETYESGNKTGTTRSAQGQHHEGGKWMPIILKQAWQRWIAAFVFIGMNITGIEESARGAGYPTRWAWAVVVASLAVAMGLYCGILNAFVRWSKQGNWLHIRIVRLGDVNLSEEDERELEKVKLEENSRFVVYKANKWLKSLLDAVNMVIHTLYNNLIAR